MYSKQFLTILKNFAKFQLFLINHIDSGVLEASLDDDARKQADPFQSNRLLMLINENISPPGRSLLIFLTTLYHQ